MTWNQIYETIADALGMPLKAVHVTTDFLARHGGSDDGRRNCRGDKSCSVVIDSSKIKRGQFLIFVCTVLHGPGNPGGLRMWLGTSLSTQVGSWV